MRRIGEKTLLARAIGAARESGLFDRIFVSTDSPVYAEEAAREGIETPWLRPAELASDKALVADTIRHTLEAFSDRGEHFDTLALVEPTSPLRLPADIVATVSAAETEGWDAAFTVTAVPLHLNAYKQYQLDTDGTARLIMRTASPNVNRQTLETTYVRNGVAYAVRSQAFLKSGSINGTQARAIIIERPVISIDSEQDFAEAEALLQATGAGGFS